MLSLSMLRLPPINDILGSIQVKLWINNLTLYPFHKLLRLLKTVAQNSREHCERVRLHRRHYSLDAILPSDKALIPPRLQTLTRLNNVICQDISLGSDRLELLRTLALCGYYGLERVSKAQETPVLEYLYRRRRCVDEPRGLSKLWGYYVPTRKGFAA